LQRAQRHAERLRRALLVAARLREHAQHAVARALADSSSLGEAAGRILQAICEALGWEHGGLWQVDAALGVLRCLETWSAPEGGFPEFAAASRQRTFAREVGLPGRVWASRRPAFVPDVVRDENFPRAGVASREGLRGALGFPILLGDEVIGVLEFFSREVSRPDEELLEMLATIGSQVGQFAERKRAEAELATLFETSPDMLCIAGLARLPQVSLPLATLDGCPLGLSLIAARGNDTLLLDLTVKLMKA